MLVCWAFIDSWWTYHIVWTLLQKLFLITYCYFDRIQLLLYYYKNHWDENNESFTSSYLWLVFWALVNSWCTYNNNTKYSIFFTKVFQYLIVICKQHQFSFKITTILGCSCATLYISTWRRTCPSGHRSWRSSTALSNHKYKIYNYYHIYLYARNLWWLIFVVVLCNKEEQERTNSGM